MRRKWLALVLFMILFFPAAVQAQEPTPPPTQTPVPICPPDLQKTCEWTGAVVTNYGLQVVFGIVLLAIVVWLVTRILKSGENVLEKNLVKQMDGLFDDAPGDYIHLYLEKFIEDYRHFKFRGLDTRARGIEAPELDQAYVSIHMTPESKKAEKQKGLTNKDIEKRVEGLADLGFHGQSEVFDLTGAIQKSDKLAIIGAAGSGKSTLLQWAGLVIARARVDKKKLTEEMRLFVKALGDKPLVPVIIPLRAFNRHCRVEKKERTAQALLDFMRAHVVSKHPSLKVLPDNFFPSIFEKTGCLLMLDGVDEVDLADRALVRRAVEDLARDYKSNVRNRYLVTSRTMAYFGEAEVSGFRKCEVQNLNSEQRNTLISSWCKAAYGGDEASLQADDLIRRLTMSDERVRALAVTPLMVTIFSLVHYNQRELPKQRADLYEHAVRIILTETYHEGEDAAELKKDWESRCRQISWIAFKMHADNLEDPPEDKLVDSIWGDWGAPSEEELAREKARAFIRKVADRGGLLEEENGRYGFFTHRTFREFLAGRYLAGKFSPSGQDFLKKHIEQRLVDEYDKWIEPIRLLAGFLAIGGDDDRPAEFVRLIDALGSSPEQRAYALTLAGLCIADLPARDAPSLDRVNTEKSIATKMCSVIQNNPPIIDMRLRNQIGLALGEIGDPRLRFSFEKDIKFIPPHLVSIPAGIFRMGTSEEDGKILKEQKAQSWDDEKPAHDVFLSEYSIGKYPVTNAEFRCFWEQDGYDPKAKWWSEDGRKWRTGQWETNLEWIEDEDLRKRYKEWLAERPVERRDRPFFWDDPKWNAHNLPVVGISWFEMEAYCNWLTHATGKYFRLPTEAEWEHAARGENNFLWAWGNQWDSNKANTDEAEKKIGGTSPVGMYPDGASSYGVQDMIGNVWEWCLDWYNQNDYKERAGKEVKNPCRLEGGTARVVRGGSWYGSRSRARCSYRLRNGPDLFSSNLGFRVVCSPSFPSLYSDSLHSESLIRNPQTSEV